MNSSKKAESIPYGGMEPGSSNARAVRHVEVPSPVKKATTEPKADTVNEPELQAADPAPAAPSKPAKVAKAPKVSKKKAGK